MTKLLERAFKKASKLPEVEQNAFVKWVMEELATERKWEKAFEGSEDILDRLADEALYEQEAVMGKEKIAITLDEEFIEELDRLVDRRVFQSRSQAIREAVSEKLVRLKRNRLAAERSKLDAAFEKAMADEGLVENVSQWPEY